MEGKATVSQVEREQLITGQKGRGCPGGSGSRLEDVWPCATSCQGSEDLEQGEEEQRPRDEVRKWTVSCGLPLCMDAAITQER